MKRCKARKKDKNIELAITLEDIKEQWKKQKGKCPYLNKKLILPLTTGKENKSNTIWFVYYHFSQSSKT